MSVKEKIRKIWLIAFPIVIQGIVFQIQSLTDKAFLGNLDAKYISALGAAQFPYNTTLDTVVALQTGLVIYVAQLTGAKKMDDIKKYVRSSALFNSILSGILFIIWVFFPKMILQLLNVDSFILMDSAVYIRICAISLLLLGVDCTLQAALQGMGNTKPIMISGILKVVLNVIISYVLIFGAFGFPKLKIAGAAIGTMIANIIASLTLIVYYLITQKSTQLLKQIKKEKICFKYYKKVVKTGLPTAAEYFLWNASNLVLIAFLNELSYLATAIYTLTFGIEVIIYAVFNGIGKSTLSIIGQEIGAEDYDNADSYLKISILQDLILVSATTVIFTVFGNYILHIFTREAELVKSASFFLIVTALIMFPKSMNVLFGNGIRAHGDTKWMLCSQMMGSVLVITFSFVTVKLLHMGIIAIYITLFLDETIRALFNAYHYRKRYATITNTKRYEKSCAMKV